MAREPGETVYQYLVRRERELVTQLPVFQQEVAVRESELAHVRSAIQQISQLGGADKLKFGVAEFDPITGTLSAVEEADDASAEGIITSATGTTSRTRAAALLLTEQATIKELILRTLWTQFREGGATSARLREYIFEVWERDIDRTSFSPQLSRLRADGLVKQKGGDDVWRLTLPGMIQCRKAWGAAENESAGQ
jgi:hypothetical protein